MLKLLLVDDEQIVREGIQSMLPLRQLNLRLTGACSNALQALDSISDDMPDILLTDVKMPAMNGLELIDRALKMNPALQCIVLSGYDEFTLAQQAIKLGVKEYLLKPCTKEVMIEALTRVCQGIRAERRRSRDSMDGRKVRIAELAAQLEMLKTNRSASRITAEQVRALVEATREESILREAFIYLIIHQGLRADQELLTIRQTYEEESSLPEAIADGLNKMERQVKPNSFVMAMCDYVHAHYRDPEISVQYLADHVLHMQADYAGREFARVTGLKLSAYLLKVRMEKAKELIVSSGGAMRVYELADEVGLGENPQYFSTLFRKYTGMTPKEYEKTFVKNTVF